MPAHAGALTALEVLQQFNLVTLGNDSTSSHVDGRSYIGGTLSGSGAVFGMHPNTTPASAYTALTVAGSGSGFQVTAGGLTALGSVSNATVNNGAAAIAGSASNSNFNGSGGAYIQGASSGVNKNSGNLSPSAAGAQFATAGSTDFAAVLKAASTALSSFASTGSYWTVSGSKVTFHAVANSAGLAVFDLTAVDDTLLAMSEFDFDLGNATSVLFNSDVATANISANFLGGSAQAIATKTIWNFYDATSLTLNSQFGGSILATGATLKNSNNIEGGVYVNQLQQSGEIHQQAYTGSWPTGPQGNATPVPEPASLALVVAALGAAAAARRRR